MAVIMEKPFLDSEGKQMNSRIIENYYIDGVSSTVELKYSVDSSARMSIKKIIRNGIDIDDNVLIYEKSNSITSENTFTITDREITFHPSQKGKFIQVIYFARGTVKVDSKEIATNYKGNDLILDEIMVEMQGVNECISDINKDLNTHESSLTVLSKKINDNEEIVQTMDDRLEKIEVDTSYKKFKPLFGVAPWFRRESGDITEKEIDEQIENFKKYGAKSICLCCHIKHDNGEFVTVEKLDDVFMAYTKILSQGLKVTTLKFMDQYSIPDIAGENIERYKQAILGIMSTWCDKFKDTTITKVTCINESENFYLDKKYEQVVLDIISMPKNMGFEVGLSTVDIRSSIELSLPIKDKVDFFACNVYPAMSYNMQNARLDECLSAWSYHELGLKTLKTFGKPIILTETGCQDRWEALSRPSNWTFINGGTPSKGEAPVLFLKSLFESNIGEYVDEVYYWYYDAIWFDKCRDIINEYTGVLK